MTRWFTSDLHLGHANIIDFCGRPWNSVWEMNEGLIERWNARVATTDVVTIVGDFVLGDKERNLPLVRCLNGHKQLLPGNHDNVWPGGKRGWRDWLGRYEDVGIEVIEMLPPQLSYPTTIRGVPVLLSHFPRYGDSHGIDRYTAWRPTEPGLLLHGHTHSPVRLVDDHLHVGVDAWDYAPVSEDELVALLDA
jgi:calcineurin-like phosphoesterase family protein